jgi:hypothetical protein
MGSNPSPIFFYSFKKAPKLLGIFQQVGKEELAHLFLVNLWLSASLPGSSLIKKHRLERAKIDFFVKSANIYYVGQNSKSMMKFKPASIDKCFLKINLEKS